MCEIRWDENFSYYSTMDATKTRHSTHLYEQTLLLANLTCLKEMKLFAMQKSFMYIYSMCVCDLHDVYWGKTVLLIPVPTRLWICLFSDLSKLPGTTRPCCTVFWRCTAHCTVTTVNKTPVVIRVGVSIAQYHLWEMTSLKLWLQGSKYFFVVTIEFSLGSFWLIPWHLLVCCCYTLQIMKFLAIKIVKKKIWARKNWEGNFFIS